VQIDGSYFYYSFAFSEKKELKSKFYQMKNPTKKGKKSGNTLKKGNNKKELSL